MSEKKVLFIDADDTLWECNIYFKEAMHRYCKLMNRHFGIEEKIVYNMILQFEKERVEKYGYGSIGFYECLIDVYEELEVIHNHKPIVNPAADFKIICENVLDFKIVLLPNVVKTLNELQSRDYELHLVTKGDYKEQFDKIKNSGLEIYFDHYEIMSEKDEKTYQEYLEKHKLKAENAVMIGNSPNSDIHPPRKIGMNTIYIPHSHNWEVEVSEVFEGEKVKIISEFSELLKLFE
jgi:putative hydrolase of the HAD superfamily